MKREIDIHSYLSTFRLDEEAASSGYTRNRSLTSFLPGKTGKTDPATSPASNTVVDSITISGTSTTLYTNEFWTSKQRQASSIHEISYRGCFKPQLPRFFINLLTDPGDVVFDPFSGRGTTIVESALMGRNIIANDVNPLSRVLIEPRLEAPSLKEIKQALDAIPVDGSLHASIDLSMFYHPTTEAELVSLKRYLAVRKKQGTENAADRWIRMVATNRLTGHSTGFFSVYTLPPNQAVSAERQQKLNEKRNQVPPKKAVKPRILSKTKSLLRDISREERENLRNASKHATYLSTDARHVASVPDGTVQLTVTSPPFLDVVQYAQDNWLRCWFNDLDAGAIGSRITMARTVDEWSEVMEAVFEELHRVTAPGGWVAFEVGEVRKGKVKLEEHVIPIAVNKGFTVRGVLINEQEFTKTSNIWGVDNNARGTNTNRIILLRRNP